MSLLLITLKTKALRNLSGTFLGVTFAAALASSRVRAQFSFSLPLLLDLRKSAILSAQLPAHCYDKNCSKRSCVLKVRAEKSLPNLLSIFKLTFGDAILSGQITCAIICSQASCILASPVLALPLGSSFRYCNLTIAHVAPWQNYERFH